MYKITIVKSRSVIQYENTVWERVVLKHSKQWSSAKPYLKPQDVSRLLGRPIRAVYYLLTIGKLPGCKLGGTWIIPRERLLIHLRETVSAVRKLAEIERKEAQNVDRKMRERQLTVIVDDASSRKSKKKRRSTG